MLIPCQPQEHLARSLKMFMCLQPPNFAKCASPKARIRDNARFATKLRKLGINSVNVNYDQ